MILKYGKFAHGNGEVKLSIVETPIYSEQYMLLRTKKTWTIRGMLIGANSSALTTAINTLRTAYATNGLDLCLYEDNGSTKTAHEIVSANSIYGTQVKEFSFPDGEGVEYATRRSYEIQVEAEFLVNDPGVNVRRFCEQISWEGATGERWVLLESLEGKPIKQTVCALPTLKASQSGEASGYLTYPTPPDPVWPDAEKKWERKITKEPKIEGGYITEYVTSWFYSFEATDEMTGNPHTGV